LTIDVWLPFNFSVLMLVPLPMNVGALAIYKVMLVRAEVFSDVTPCRLIHGCRFFESIVAAFSFRVIHFKCLFLRDMDLKTRRAEWAVEKCCTVLFIFTVTLKFYYHKERRRTMIVQTNPHQLQ
jgi:hypothetical protein